MLTGSRIGTIRCCLTTPVAWAVFFVFWASSSPASTIISGGNLINQTWTAAGSPYIVMGDITVPPNTTFTINPGVDVQFASADSQGTGLDPSRIELTVNGSLNVNGTPASPVQFRAQSGSGTSIWHGIVVGTGESASVNLEYPVVSNASVGLNAVNAAFNNVSLTGGLFNVSNNLDLQLSANSPTYSNSLTVSKVNGPLTLLLNVDFYHSGSPRQFVMNGAFWQQFGAGLYHIRLDSPSQFDNMLANGSVNLQGSLLVDASHLVASVGDRFTIINKTSAGTINQPFQNAPVGRILTDSGYSFSISYTGGDGNDVVLEVQLPGDFDQNHVVDAADYVVWRKGLNTILILADYDVWRSHFGQSIGSAAATTFAVPEAGSWLPIAIIFLSRRSQRRSKVLTTPLSSLGARHAK